jgi:hypothetical protein
MGSPHAEDARRPLVPRRNFAAGEESAGQIGEQSILTLTLGDRGGRELCSRLVLEKLLDFITFFASYFYLHKLNWNFSYS